MSSIRTVSYAIIILLAVFLTGCANTAAPAKGADHLTIIAIGDMHGDYNAYEGLMLDSGLMDENGDWSGGKTLFVQTGDIPDRGPDTRKMIDSLQRLEMQAPKFGGKVLPLVGNHEAMNMLGDLRYVHKGEFAAFTDANSLKAKRDYYNAHKVAIETEFRRNNPGLSAAEIQTKWESETPLGKVEHQAAWGPDGYIGRWIADNQLVAKVDGYLFAHGGFSFEFAKYSLEELNALGSTALREQNKNRNSILRHRKGPLWYRGNVRGREKGDPITQDREIEKVLSTYEATHIIVGHTRNESGIRTSLNGRLIQIDTGASAHYGGVPSYLRIENGKLYAHEAGKVRTLN